MATTEPGHQQSNNNNGSDMTSEGTLSFLDQQAYKVDYGNIDHNIITACEAEDNERINQLTMGGNVDFDVFICILKQTPHARILCKPVGNGKRMCSIVELCFKSNSNKQYEVRIQECTVATVEIKQKYHIGTYENVHYNALQIAAFKSVSPRYHFILDDCVEFAKKFCLCLLSYCSNKVTLENNVKKNIEEAIATGLSVEATSRQIPTAGATGNIVVGGLNNSAINGQFRLIAFVLIYTPVVACLTAMAAVYFLKNEKMA